MPELGFLKNYKFCSRSYIFESMSHNLALIYFDAQVYIFPHLAYSFCHNDFRGRVLAARAARR